jgi:adenosylhomocysteine nucleosidase
MFLRALLQTWLQNAAKAKLHDAAVQAAQRQLVPPTAPPPAEEPETCHLGVVFALGIESGCFEDVLQGAITIRGGGFVGREGGLKGRRVVVMLSGAGRQSAAHATEVLIDGHRPRRVISAGFAGGLCPQAERNDILVADRLLSTEGNVIAIELPAGLSAAMTQPGVRCGPLLTADRVVRLPAQRRSLFERHGAMAVDMETFAVAEVCLRRGVPFSSVRVVNDTADETLPRDVEHLLVQQSGAAQWGAALGAIWRRPASIKDMYQLRENALVASLRLAKFLAEASFD